MDVYLKKFEIGCETQLKIVEKIASAYQMGLETNSDNQMSKQVPMLPSYTSVTSFKCKPSIEKFSLAFDFGNTNFRVLLFNTETFEQEGKSAKIPEKYKKCHYTELFDYFAEFAKEFLQNSTLLRDILVQNSCCFDDVELNLGFTFSQPLKQISKNQALVLAMTMGYDIEGIIMKDVGQMTSEALKRAGVKGIRVTAICNDTVGTLFSAIFDQKRLKNEDNLGEVKAGFIVGTGSNIAYLERTENIKSIGNDYLHENMIINTECCAFGSDSESYQFLLDENIITNIDQDIDNSRKVDKGKNAFGKMIGGMYLCKIVKMAMFEMWDKGLLKFNRDDFRNADFDSSFLSEMASTDSFPSDVVSEICRVKISAVDAEKIKDLCDAVVVRSITLMACAFFRVVEFFNFVMKNPN